MRRKLVCGNWKLNHNLDQTRAFIRKLRPLLSVPAVDVVIAPVVTTLFAACEETRGSQIQIAAQNVFYAASGAYTGEWSVAHLAELGCQYAIVGHSERRQYFNESDEGVGKKARALLDGGLIPIACVGESLGERQSNQTELVLSRQLSGILDALVGVDCERLILAYEPVWAIGTGQVASLAQARDAHVFLRGRVQAHFGKEAAQAVRILYGGSVKPDNAAELLGEIEIDGALVGGASLTVDSFMGIVKAVL